MSWQGCVVGMECVVLEVSEVVGKQRPRATARRGHARVYTPRKTRVFEERIRKAWSEQVGDRWAAHAGPVEVIVLVERELAKSNPKKWAGREDLQRPDLDNVLKAVLDALNGLAYADDSTITRETARKMPRTPHGSGNKVVIQCIYHSEKYEKESR